MEKELKIILTFIGITIGLIAISHTALMCWMAIQINK